MNTPPGYFVVQKREGKGYRKLVGPLEQRQQARQWARRRAWKGPLLIKHPDGTLEPFTWSGTTLKITAP